MWGQTHARCHRARTHPRSRCVKSEECAVRRRRADCVVHVQHAWPRTCLAAGAVREEHEFKNKQSKSSGDARSSRASIDDEERATVGARDTRMLETALSVCGAAACLERASSAPLLHTSLSLHTLFGCRGARAPAAARRDRVKADPRSKFPTLHKGVCMSKDRGVTVGSSLIVVHPI